MAEHIIEICPFKKWALFFRFTQEPMQRKLINDIIRGKEEIGMAATLLQEISQDEHERARLRSRRMYEMDQYSNLHTSELRGELREREKWQAIVADKDTEIELLRSQIAKLKDK